MYSGTFKGLVLWAVHKENVGVVEEMVSIRLTFHLRQSLNLTSGSLT